MVKIDTGELVAFLDEHLRAGEIPDVSRNGLQVQGAEAVRRVGLAVDACLASYEAAVTAGCELLVVHHGLIWGGLAAITGPVYRQVKYLVENDLNLYAAHLPLDLHPESGNNIGLARLLDIADPQPFGSYKGIDIGFSGSLPAPLPVQSLADRLRERIGGPTQVLPFGPERVSTVGIVSGGGSDSLDEAIEKGLDCLITGEPQHWNHHRALEGTIHVIYAGHYHTEMLGVKALGELLEQRFGVASTFLDIPTLV